MTTAMAENSISPHKDDIAYKLRRRIFLVRMLVS